MVRLLSLPMIVSAWTSLLLAVFFLVLSGMIARRTEEHPRHYRFFALMALSNGVFLAAFSVLVNASADLAVLDPANRLTIVAATFTIAFSIQFFAVFFRFRPLVPMGIVYAGCAVFSVLCLVPSEAFLQTSLYPTCSYYVGLEFGPLFQVWGLFIVTLSLYGLGMLLSIGYGALGARDRIDRRHVVVLIGACSVWLLTALADCLTGVQVLDLPPLAWLGSFFTTVAIAGVLVSHIDALYRDKGILYQELIHDHLTGAFSRSFFEVRLAELVRRSGRNPRLRAYVAMLDIDDFKAVNDSYGHAAGDRVLRETVAVLFDCVRESDAVARVGGDEFALLLMDVETDAQAAVVVERVQDRLARASARGGDHHVPVTCSFGLTALDQAVCRGRTGEDFVTAADEAMYEAKRAGKNTLRFRRLEAAPEPEAALVEDFRRPGRVSRAS